MSSRKPVDRSSRKKTLRKQIPESLLARLWRERAARQRNFRTTEGKRVRILYPGRQGVEAGPDFRDALIFREGTGLVRGDVELHLHPKDWDRHGHSSDHRYNSVVLHGVLAPPESSQPLPNGGSAPAVGLQSLLEFSSDGEAPRNGTERGVLWALLESRGYPKPATRTDALRLLERAGRARFLGKSAGFSSLIEEIGPHEALYRSMMESLGYSENRTGFLELARRVPYRTLSKAVSRIQRRGRAAFIKNMLLATAGFENSGSQPLLVASVMDSRRWHLFRIRPANHPRRRIIRRGHTSGPHGVRRTAGIHRPVCTHGVIQDHPAKPLRRRPRRQDRAHRPLPRLGHGRQRLFASCARPCRSRAGFRLGRRSAGPLHVSPQATAQPDNPRDGRYPIPRALASSGRCCRPPAGTPASSPTDAG